MITMEQINKDLEDVNLFDILQIIISVNEELKNRVPNKETDVVIPYSEMCYNPNYRYEEDDMPHRIYHQYVLDKVAELFDASMINDRFKPYTEYAVNFIILTVPSKELFYGDLKLLWLVNHLKNLDIDDMLMYSDTKYKIVETIENEHLKYYDDDYKTNIVSFCHELYEYFVDSNYYDTYSVYETIVMSIFNNHSNFHDFLEKHENILNNKIWYTNDNFRNINIINYLLDYIEINQNGELEFINIENVYICMTLIENKDIQTEFEF